MKISKEEYYSKLVKINLRRIKKEQGWTIRMMAAKLNLSESHVSSLLSLKSSYVPQIHLLGRICDVVADLDITYFFEEVQK